METKAGDRIVASKADVRSLVVSKGKLATRDVKFEGSGYHCSP